MKIKELRKILNKLNPEGEVYFHLEIFKKGNFIYSDYISEIEKITKIPGYMTKRLTDIEICLKINKEI
jgi:hypothetical protein